jgi:hypothetical protein
MFSGAGFCRFLGPDEVFATHGTRDETHGTTGGQTSFGYP